MSIKDRLAAKAAGIGSNPRSPRPEPEIPSRPKTAPGQLMASLPLLAEKERELEVLRARIEELEAGATGGSSDEIARLKKELADAQQSGAAIDIRLRDLHEVPGRRRHMPAEKYAELRENLRHNKLIHPIVVLPRPEGGFEILSGHHRTDALRELGRESVRCVVVDATTEEADEGAFFANLMQSDLTDYEKYVGLKRFQQTHADLKQAEIAGRIGISQSYVSLLLSYDRLPNAARAVLEANVGIVGATAAAELASLSELGKSERVVEAVLQVSVGKLDQAQAVRFARDGDRTKVEKPLATTFKVKSGKSTWCDVRRAKNVMRIEFQSEEVAQSVQDAIKRTLEDLASVSRSELRDEKS
ncbi:MULTISPECIES: ParB/RepB/Spo0J family partition protein [unclassified Caballeronia]|uniref:ParB/RepB/Spo0J family partition protein n=1 Tax=unclassified Caballeronia TaxID=2646786 RepID=UPI0020298E89|nr:MULTISPECIES: ParB/RepB/Spo0J family partition protein [unclassified Caballeronia]MDR5785206.1 ParB/RepB/Spo0J family partition protein [Caballeronia sp. LP003]